MGGREPLTVFDEIVQVLSDVGRPGRSQDAAIAQGHAAEFCGSWNQPITLPAFSNCTAISTLRSSVLGRM